MNDVKHTTRPASPPAPFHNAADEINRARAIVLTVWMAMGYPNLSGGCDGDIGALSDTLYEAYQRLGSAEKLMGVHHG